LGIFETLAAPLWAQRARSELSRLGLRPPAPLALTDTEERVAALAAAGHTNRQVAQALFLSPKTVEANLARIYRKLGISSRAELGRAVARTPPPRPPTPPPAHPLRAAGQPAPPRAAWAGRRAPMPGVVGLPAWGNPRFLPAAAALPSASHAPMTRRRREPAMDQICLVVPVLPGRTADARDFM